MNEETLFSNPHEILQDLKLIAQVQKLFWNPPASLRKKLLKTFTQLMAMPDDGCYDKTGIAVALVKVQIGRVLAQMVKSDIDLTKMLLDWNDKHKQKTGNAMSVEEIDKKIKETFNL